LLRTRKQIRKPTVTTPHRPASNEDASLSGQPHIRAVLATPTVARKAWGSKETPSLRFFVFGRMLMDCLAERAAR
jgi:hypothetical protein